MRSLRMPGLRLWLFAGCLAVTLLCSCELLMPKGEVYISADGTYGSYNHVCSLVHVTYVDKGANMGAGENIYAKNAGTKEYGGRTWMVYKVPRYVWDIVIGYRMNTDTKYGRHTINLDLNEWAAIWVDGADPVKTKSFQSSGSFAIPTM